jgi:uncharacterized protein YndB with AHSA1/START domain
MRTIVKTAMLSVFLLIVCHGASRADIADSSFYGFTVKQEYTVRALPDSLYKYLQRDVSTWWSSQHTFSGNAANLVIQPKANGCFCEKLPDGGSVRHMTVIYVDPGKVLRMQGALGPAQELAANAVLTILLRPAEGGTTLKITYTVGGYSPVSFASFAQVTDKVLTELFEGLKRFAEGK